MTSQTHFEWLCRPQVMRARPVSHGALKAAHTGMQELMVNFLRIFARCLMSHQWLDMIHGRRLYSMEVSGLTNQVLFQRPVCPPSTNIPLSLTLFPCESKWWMILSQTPSHCSPAVSQALPPGGKEKSPYQRPLSCRCVCLYTQWPDLLTSYL